MKRTRRKNLVPRGGEEDLVRLLKYSIYSKARSDAVEEKEKKSLDVKARTAME
jgi:hypothetical protein